MSIAEREERRQADLAEQSSIRNAPGERIRIWERMHGLALPRDPHHNLLSVIAIATDLEIEQVQEEQRLRLQQQTPVYDRLTVRICSITRWDSSASAADTSGCRPS